MAIDLCDVEETLRCNPSPDDELFKNLVLRALLGIAGGGGGGGGGAVTVTSIAPGNTNIGDVDVASIAPGTNNIGKVVLTDGTSDATVRNLAANDALNVAIVDAAGNHLTTFAGTEFAVGDATGATPDGGLMLFKERTGFAQVAQAIAPVPVTQYAGFWVTGQTLSMGSTVPENIYQTDGQPSGIIQITGAGGGGNLRLTGSLDGINWDNVDIPVFATAMTMSPATQSNTVSALTLKAHVFSTRGYRFIRVKVSATNSGTVTYALSFGSNNLVQEYVIPDNAVNMVIPGTSSNNLGKQEDGVSNSGDTGVSALGVRRDTPSVNALVSANNDYAPIIVDNLGKTWTAGDQTDDLAYASGDRGSSTFGVRTDAPAAITPAVGDYAPVRVSDFGAVWTEQVKRTAVFGAIGLIASGALTNTYATLKVLPVGTKIFTIKNLTNTDIWCSDDAVNNKFQLAAGDKHTVDLGSVGLTTSATISARWLSALASTGYVVCEVVS